MDRMKFETPNLTAENVTKIAELFPGVVTEGKVNIDLLRSMLGDEVYSDEAYEFTWVGKRTAIAEAGRPIRKTLRPCVEESREWDTTENLYIEGDNLDVLKLLQESYLGKVKMIYIDPPYNTGNDFVYRDNFTASREDYEEDAGVYGEDGDRLFKNTETNGRFHSDWCSMIYPRLVLARNLLREDGVIFISIDDNEVTNLTKICDEVFGADNYINTIALKTKASAGASGGGEDKRLKKNAEFILIYAKNKSGIDMQQPIEKIRISDFIEEHKKNNIGFYYTRILDDIGEKTLIKEIGEMKIFEHKNYKFSTISEKIATENLSLDQAYSKYFDKIFMVTNAQTSILTKVNDFTPNAQMLISYEYIPKTGKDKNKLTTKFIWNKTLVVWFADSAEKINNSVFKYENMGTLWDDISWGRLDLQGDVPFKNGKKPLKLLERLLQMQTDNDSIILDFFSGSATTAHAVMQLNAEDGGKRKFIMVQLPEVTDEKSEAYKAGYKNICEIGKERIRRAGDKIKAEAGLTALNLDIGFRVLKLDDTNMKDVYYAAGDYTQDMIALMESNIKPDRTDLDLLYGCLLDWGLPLSMPHTHEKIDGFTIHTYNDGDLIACFEERISEKAIREIASRKPLRAVFRDSSFNSSPEKINVFEIFKLLAPNTNVRVI